MPDTDHSIPPDDGGVREDIQRLRQYVADLEAENSLLRGSAVPSASSVALRARNAELRHEIAALSASAGDEEQAGGERLTVEQTARELNVSSRQVLRELRESLPLSVDAAGRAVVAREDIDAYLLARAQGRPTKRFL